MKFPVVSVIVPICHVEPYLRPCIDSICGQTYSQLEILLIEDGSPDGCGAICDRYAELDSRITVIHKENGGLSSARNAGLDIAAGTYVAFVDADDAIHPKFIETLAGICEEYGCDIAQCDFLTVSEQSSKLPLNTQRPYRFLTGRQGLHELCAGTEDVKYTVAWNKVYRRELFAGIRYPVGRIHEDEFTTYRALWKTRKMAVIHQYLYYYLQRSESIIGRAYSIKRLDALDAFRERLIFLKEKKLETEYFATMRTYIALIERTCAGLKRDVSGSEDVCAGLLKEKRRLEGQFPPVPAMERQESWEQEWSSYCPYPETAKVVLYGAGGRGKAYYQWIRESHCGEVVGWVDNSWRGIRDAGYPVTPLDSLLSMSYDYILVTPWSRAVQENIILDLKCWGIPEGKILAV